MRKDIEIPTVTNVHIVAIKEWNQDFTDQQWNVYLINGRHDQITTVLVMSRGQSNDKKTSTLRHGLGNLLPQTFAKVEFIPTEVLGFTNEYLVTFFAEDKLFERKFIFAPNSISEEKTIEIPIIESEGIMAK